MGRYIISRAMFKCCMYGQPIAFDLRCFHSLLNHLISILTATLLLASPAFAGSITLSWTPPITNEDGTPLTGLSGYKIYYGMSPDNYKQNINVGTVTTYTVNNLTNGLTYYFAVTAYDTSLNESAYSNIVSKTIPSSQHYSLTINKAGNCSGTVTSSSSGINCGTDCSETYNSGTTVTLTASPDAGSTFAGWSGACSGTGVCTITMNTTKSVTATFQHSAQQSFQQYPLTIKMNKSDTGAGMVMSSPPGIICGSDCFENYTEGTVVTLTVVQNKSSIFSRWSGACSGTGTCTVTMNSAKSVTATFTDHGEPALTLAGLPVTGQTVSYAPGDDGYLQSGVQWPTPRFMDNGDGTITDSLTGLMWLKDGGCLRKKWKDALQTIVDLNANPDIYSCLDFSANYSDWRLPDIKELESLVNYGASNSAEWLNTNGFSNVKSLYYWSSTSHNGGVAWVIRMNSGINKPGSNSMSCYLLPVRTGDTDAPAVLPDAGQAISGYGDEGNTEAGDEWPTPRFMDNGDGTITDSLTGLMWLKDGGCLRKKWDDALLSVADLNANPGSYNCLGYSASYTDWRLPNIRELESLVEYGTSDIASLLNEGGFLNVISSRYWTSTTYPNKSSRKWVVNMKRGDASYSGEKSRYQVLPVRSVDN